MKVCLVTGASKGIGAAICEALLKAGHRVYGTMRKPEPRSFEMLQMDVTDRASIEAAVQHILEKEGRIDVLVNNAGHGLMGTVEMVTDQEMQEQFDVNVFGLIRTTQAVLPSMREHKSGCIINIGSIVGVYCTPFASLYSASKFAVESITLSLAVTLKPYNIRTHLVDPGWVATKMLQGIQMGTRKSPDCQLVDNAMQAAHEAIASGQDPKEVGQLIVKLVASEDADFRNPTSSEGNQILDAILAEPTGNTWVKETQELYRSWE